MPAKITLAGTALESGSVRLGESSGETFAEFARPMTRGRLGLAASAAQAILKSRIKSGAFARAHATTEFVRDANRPVANDDVFAMRAMAIADVDRKIPAAGVGGRGCAQERDAGENAADGHTFKFDSMNAIGCAHDRSA